MKSPVGARTLKGSTKETLTTWIIVIVFFAMERQPSVQEREVTQLGEGDEVGGRHPARNSTLTIMRSILLLLLPMSAAALTFPTRLVYESPTGLFFENIPVRPCNKLLLTSVVSPTLHSAHVRLRRHQRHLDEVHIFPNATAFTGITEYVFAIVASKLNTTTRRSDDGTVTVWRLDLTTGTPRVTKIAGTPNGTLNGLSAVARHPDDLVLVADSPGGAVHQIDMRKRTTHLAIMDPAMAAGEPLSPQSCAVPEVLDCVVPAEAEHVFDDFGMHAEGRAWIGTHPSAITLVYPAKNGTWGQENVTGDPAGGATIFDLLTSAAFGHKGAAQNRTLFVVTGKGRIVTGYEWC
ncbi:hypothetical protein C8R43DRAFT_1104141 [Mycena crocata]|nr:hypothetical protein C8R43DRAFT_1104141 [Mycena crocata]